MELKAESVRDRWYSRIRDKYGISKEKLEKWRKERKEKFENGEKALSRYLEEGQGTKSVQTFFQTCIDEKSFGREFSKEEVEKLGKVIFMDEKFLNKANLRFVMTGYAEKCDHQMCKEYFNKLLRFFRHTIYGDAIEKFIQAYNEEINKKILEIKKRKSHNIPIIPTGNGEGTPGTGANR